MTQSSDLFAAMAGRSRQVAAGRAVNYAAGNRTYQVSISRPLTEPTFDRNTRQMQRHTPELVYLGPARVMPVTPSGMTDLGDAPLWWAQARISIPAEEVDSRIDDIVTVLDDGAGVARAGNVADRQFRVTGVARGGFISIGLVLDVTGVEPSRENQL